MIFSFCAGHGKWSIFPKTLKNRVKRGEKDHFPCPVQNETIDNQFVDQFYIRNALFKVSSPAAFFYSRLFSVGLVPPLLWPITDAQGGDSTPRTLTHDPFINGPAPTALLPHAMEGVIPEIFRLRKSPGVG